MRCGRRCRLFAGMTWLHCTALSCAALLLASDGHANRYTHVLPPRPSQSAPYRSPPSYRCFFCPTRLVSLSATMRTLSELVVCLIRCDCSKKGHWARSRGIIIINIPTQPSHAVLFRLTPPILCCGFYNPAAFNIPLGWPCADASAASG